MQGKLVGRAIPVPPHTLDSLDSAKEQAPSVWEDSAGGRKPLTSALGQEGGNLLGLDYFLCAREKEKGGAETLGEDAASLRSV